MATPEFRSERKETARGLIVSGWIVLIFDGMVMFFLPAAHRIGDNKSFVLIIGGLAVIAIAMIVAGYVMRGRATRGV